MKIETYLSSETLKTKQDLMRETGLTDRELRNQISILKKTRAVIYNSKISGFRLAKDIKSFNTAEEAREELRLIEHCINDMEARKRDLSKSESTYIAYKKDIEHEIMLLENANHIPCIR